MNTILIGYSSVNRNGVPQGEPQYFGGSDSREQSRIFDQAKRLHKFPEGIVYLEFGVVQTQSVAIQISKETSVPVVVETPKTETVQEQPKKKGNKFFNRS